MKTNNAETIIQELLDATESPDEVARMILQICEHLGSADDGTEDQYIAAQEHLLAAIKFLK